MKTIILSFDDARLDFYTRAMPILQKYHLPATLNVITDFVEEPKKYTQFLSGKNLAMTYSQIRECQQKGIEIACHGHLHKNNAEDILSNIEHLRKAGLSLEQGIGFASPNSQITEENKREQGVWQLVETDVLKYVRSGIQIRREGVGYSVLSAIDMLIHSPKLFYWLNRKNIIETILPKNRIIPSVAIFSYTTLQQIQYMIDKMPDETTLILMFHSILMPQDIGYGKDKWFWDSRKFNNLCKYCAEKTEINVSTTINVISH